jgi:hypothetical protein
VDSSSHGDSNILATAEGYSHKGHAEGLKRPLLELAKVVGVEKVIS